MSKERKPLYFLETFDKCRISIYEEVTVKSVDGGHRIVTLSDKIIGFIPTECTFVLSKCEQEV